MNFIKKYFREAVIGLLVLFSGGTMLGGGFYNPTSNPTPNINPNLGNGSYSGTWTTLQPGEDVVAGDLVYLKSDGKMWKADANAVTTTPSTAIATANIASTTTGVFLLQGYYRNDALYNFATGSVIYTSIIAGQSTTTQPSATNDMIQSIGTAVEEDIIYFKPDVYFSNSL